MTKPGAIPVDLDRAISQLVSQYGATLVRQATERHKAKRGRPAGDPNSLRAVAEHDARCFLEGRDLLSATSLVTALVSDITDPRKKANAERQFHRALSPSSPKRKTAMVRVLLLKHFLDMPHAKQHETIASAETLLVNSGAAARRSVDRLKEVIEPEPDSGILSKMFLRPASIADAAAGVEKHLI